MKRQRIDKSQLFYGEQERKVEPKYRDSYKDSVCAASRNGIDLCARPAVGAHIRAGEYSGAGQKPSDDLTLPLCDICHPAQEEFKGSQAEWFLENVLKPQLRRRFRRWRKGYELDPETRLEEQCLLSQ